MSHHEEVENNPLREFKFALVFVALFAALVGWILYGGLMRPAAPQTMEETLAAIALPAPAEASVVAPSSYVAVDPVVNAPNAALSSAPSTTTSTELDAAADNALSAAEAAPKPVVKTESKTATSTTPVKVEPMVNTTDTATSGIATAPAPQ